MNEKKRAGTVALPNRPAPFETKAIQPGRASAGSPLSQLPCRRSLLSLKQFEGREGINLCFTGWTALFYFR